MPKIRRNKKKENRSKKQPVKKAASIDIKILSLDIASKLGWAISESIYGLCDLTTRKDESQGMKLLRFKSKLVEIYNLEKPDLIVYERPAGAHKNALIHEAKLISQVESWCEEMEINYRSYSPGEIKKFATGKGNASKDMMVKAAQEKLGYIGGDDNEADALWMLKLAQRDLNV